MTFDQNLDETVTLSQAKSLIKSLAEEQSLLLLSPPGVGKSDIVAQAAAEAKLSCRSLLGTQIAPEDVSGIPRIVGERSVFCPPRILLPEDPKPFCLFLDELPACAPDIQKAFYALLLERRLGEHPLPKGTWVVAAGNRSEDRALVRTISSALINRVNILHIRVDLQEWLEWAHGNGIREEVLQFIESSPESLMREVPNEPEPFSTPRAWASLSRAIDLAEKSQILNPSIRRALAFGRISAKDASLFCEWLENEKKKTPGELRNKDVKELRLEELGLSVRARNCLRSENIATVADLIAYTEEELMEIRNCGQNTISEIRAKLEELGLSLSY